MRFTVIGHACLRIETSGPTILVDPWLTGSCYWRSWWHFPTDADPTPELLAPDVVYLTHHHFDHFHYPSMRQVDKGAEVLCARFGVDVMADEVRDLGFRTVSELPHGEIRELAPGVRVASYQYGFDDTAFVVADGDTVLADLNDCKIRGRALRQIAQDFGPVTFLLKTHSWAQSYPHLYEAEDAEDLSLLKRQTYLDEFIDATRTLQPRFAVPFANMVAFLHPESWAMNAEMITPDEVRAAFERADGLEHTALVAMSPGDKWSDERGFDVSGTRWWDDRLPRMTQMAAAVAPTLAATAAEEAQRPLAFADFEHHLAGFLQAVPRPALRMLLKRPIVFEVPRDEQPYWVVDGRRRRVWRQATPPADRANLIRVAPAVLADAIEKRILHFVHGSMRIRVALRPGGVNEDLAFWGLLMIWEIGYLPVRNLASRRFLDAVWRRRREAVGSLGMLRGSGSPLKRLSEGFAVPTDDDTGTTRAA
ncbi:MAG TPA: MBL fold metallo-hydrolase [Acidimicrobiales bacterium]